MTVSDIIISALTGVAASFFVWWWTFKYLVPKINFADSISRLETDENNSGFRFRLKFENSGSRNIIDLQVLIRLRIKGIRQEYQSNWEVVYIPTSSLDYRNVAIVRPASSGGLRPLLEIKTYECEYFKKNVFPQQIRDLANNNQLTLDDVLEIGAEANFQILALGYDEFSGSRKFYESKSYTKNDIINGHFDLNSLNIAINVQPEYHMIDSQNDNLPFKQFLDQSTNLITIFGVLNALFVYATTIDNKTAQAFLLPSFFVLSLFVWLEIIKFALKSSDNSYNYDIFYFLACSIELGLIIYFVSIFSPLLFLVGIFAIWFLFTYLIAMAIVKILASWLSKRGEKARKNFLLLIFTIALIASMLVLKLISPMVTPLVEKIPMDKSILK